MRQVFDERELEETELAHETDFTLGTVGLLIVGASILAVCGLCFGLGYAAGHRGSVSTTAAVTLPMTSPDAPLIATAGKQKPTASPLPVAATASADAPVSDAGSANDPDADIVNPAGTAQAQTPPARPASGSASGSQWTVKPALPQQPVASGLGVTPAVGAAAGIMVQIASVSHIEDAEVLVNALRRRGYTVTSHRDLADNLIHVQVGPFNNRNDANAMRMKLLNDGYNAIIEP
jgi:DedD protein